MRQIFLDTETTGLDPDTGDRVVELGCVELINRELTGNNLHLYFNCDRESSPEALAVHGLTQEFLSQHQEFKTHASKIADYLKDAEILIHNASFDVKFLDAEFAQAGLEPTKHYVSKVTDTLAMAREMFPGKRNNLDALCNRFEISNEHRVLHGALLDSELLAQVWLAMTRGQFGLSLDEAASDQSNTKKRNIVLEADDLPVIKASVEEIQNHEQYLNDLDQTSGDICLWHQLQQ